MADQAKRKSEKKWQATQMRWRWQIKIVILRKFATLTCHLPLGRWSRIGAHNIDNLLSSPIHQPLATMQGLADSLIPRLNKHMVDDTTIARATQSTASA
eukprot:5578998-Ditylum_brightwellii.AAC.1